MDWDFTEKRLSFLIIILSCVGCFVSFEAFSGARCRTKPALMWVATSSIDVGKATFRWIFDGIAYSAFGSVPQFFCVKG